MIILYIHYLSVTYPFAIPSFIYQFSVFGFSDSAGLGLGFGSDLIMTDPGPFDGCALRAGFGNLNE